MPDIVELAPAKINLSLEVLGRRAGGYHELRSRVVFADIGDRLVVTPAAANRLEISGPYAAGLAVDERNLIWKAWRHLRELMDVPYVKVSLEKNLPLAAGLGGGSADAAAMLRALLRLGAGKLGDEQFQGLVAIGADVPVCFHSQNCMMEGIGEKITPLAEALPEDYVLVNPGVPCETTAVFKAFDFAPDENGFHHERVGKWRNDLTLAAIATQPVIAEVLNALRRYRLNDVAMSGSGATCFGVAQNREDAKAQAGKLAAEYPQWWVKPIHL